MKHCLKWAVDMVILGERVKSLKASGHSFLSAAHSKVLQERHKLR